MAPSRPSTRNRPDYSKKFGEQIEQVIVRRGDGYVGQLSVTPIQCRFALKEVDVHSIRFR